MLTADAVRGAFERALRYESYVATGSPDQQVNWARVHSRIALSDAQRSLIAGFIRRTNVLVLSGTWCGDCVHQCPMLERIAEANRGALDVRFADRDRFKDIAEHVRICAGYRVPTAIFTNEDFEFVSLLGDRTLARYRAIAARSLGPSCPLPGAELPADEAGATLADWVNEFERVQLLLRLSPYLRERHAD